MILLREGFRVNVLNAVKAVPEVCTIFCATANPVAVLVAVTNRGRGIIGVIVEPGRHAVTVRLGMSGGHGAGQAHLHHSSAPKIQYPPVAGSR